MFITYDYNPPVFARLVIATQHRIVCPCRILRFDYSKTLLCTNAYREILRPESSVSKVPAELTVEILKHQATANPKT
jgi:hypothetical protein